jgi:hypothetical protein
MTDDVEIDGVLSPEDAAELEASRPKKTRTRRKPEVPLPPVNELVAEPPKVATVTPADRKKDWVWIVLEDSEETPATGHPIGYNGTAYLLQPGVPAHVPPGVISVLNDAITTQIRVDPATGQNIGTRDRLRLPYRRIDPPAQMASAA